MRSIAIDLGDKICGIAIEVEKIAIPKKIVGRVDIIKEIKSFFREYDDINTIVVGLPYDLYGKNLKQLEKTQKFIEKIKVIFSDIEIVGIDERFTSFAANYDFMDNKSNKNKRNDDISASLILESYLNRKQ